MVNLRNGLGRINRVCRVKCFGEVKVTDILGFREDSGRNYPQDEKVSACVYQPTGKVISRPYQFAKNAWYKFLSGLLLFLVSTLIISCASGGGGGGSGGGGPSRTIFSHSSYSFVNSSASLSATAADEIFAAILLDENLIKRLVGSVLKLDDDELISSLTEGSSADDDYILELGFSDKDPSSAVNTFFGLRRNPSNSNEIHLLLSNPIGIDLSYGELFDLVPSLTVDALITVYSVSGGQPTELKRSVEIKFKLSEDTDLGDLLLFNAGVLSTSERSVREDPPARDEIFPANLSDVIPVGSRAGSGFSFSSLWGSADFNREGEIPSGGRLTGGSVTEFVTSDLHDGLRLLQDINVVMSAHNSSSFNSSSEVWSGSFSFSSGSNLTDLNGNGTGSLLEFLDGVQLSADAGDTMLGVDPVSGLPQFNLTVLWSFSYTLTRSFDASPLTRVIPGNINLTRSLSLAEDSFVADYASGVPRNSLSAYGISLAEGDDRTIFFDLRSGENVSLPCLVSNRTRIYLDNDDYRVKSSYLIDYEEGLSVPVASGCRLAVSLTGVDYSFIAVPVLNNTGAEIFGVNVSPGDEFSSPSVVSAGERFGCSSPNYSCYYPSLDLAVVDVDEPPIIELYEGVLFDKVARNFAGSYESVGNTTNSFGGPVNAELGEGLITGGNSSDISNLSFSLDDYDLRVLDEDYNGEVRGNDRGRILDNPSSYGFAENVSVSGVSPAHGRDIFGIAIVPQTDNSAVAYGHYNLTVDPAELDYEKFSSEELAANDGKAIYRISITARDRGGKSSTRSFDFEVRDVIYSPVSSAGFVKSGGVLNGTGGSPLYLLSGIQPFTNGLHRLGSYMAIDPETGDDSDLVYSFFPSNVSDLSSAGNRLSSAEAEFGSNFALIGNSTGSGKRLIVSGSELGPSSSGFISLMAIHKSLLSSVSGSGAAERTLSAAVALGSLNGNLDSRHTAVVSLEVNDNVYSSLTGPSRPGNLLNRSSIITFSSGYLLGSLGENASFGVNVRYDGGSEDNLTFNIDGSSVESFVPRFGFVPLSVFPADLLADLALLGSGFSSSADNFVMDTSSGAISIREGVSLSFPSVDYLPVVVYNASSGSPSYTGNDIAVVAVVTEDVNSAPVFSLPSGGEVPSVVSLVIDENMDPGSEIYRFRVSDDNDKLSGLSAMSSNTNIFGIELRSAADNATEGIINLSISPDYETSSLHVVNIGVSDSGRYMYDFTTRGASVVSPAEDILSSVFILNVTVRDLVEKPRLVGSSLVGSIPESAAVGDVVGGVSVSVANLRDLDEFGDSFDANSFSFSISGPFNGILGAGVSKSGEDPNVGVVSLMVLDSDRLENLGDGRTFPLGLNISHSDGGDSNELALRVQVSNDPDNSDLVLGLKSFISGLSSLRIRENQVSLNSSYTFPASSFNPIDSAIVKDSDDLFFGSPSGFFDLSVSLISENLGNNLPGASLRLAPPGLVRPDVVDFNITSGDRFLRILDGSYVDAELFGDISFEMQVINRVAVSPVAHVASVNITVLRADPAHVTFGGVPGGTPLPSNTPPVYRIGYTQTDYVSSPVNISIGSIVNSSVLSLVDGLSGVDEIYDGIRLANGELRDLVELADGGRFIDRMDPREEFSVVIPFVSSSDLIEESVQILVEDEFGRLIDAGRNFSDYFEYSINNSAAPKYIEISQKRFAATTLDGSETTPYNSLDTFPLFQEDGMRHNLNYFIRVGAESPLLSASNYAIAQFNLVIEAPVINLPTKLIGAALVPGGMAADFNFNKSSLEANGVYNFNVSGGINSISLSENEITPNSFGDYKLVLRFNNSDARASIMTEEESLITISVASGRDNSTGLTNDMNNDNIASDGELIQLSNSTSVDPEGGTVRIRDMSGAFGSDAALIYNKIYDFALAKNVAGSARIDIEVLDRDSLDLGAIPLGRSSMVLVVNVTAVDIDTSTATVVSTVGSTNIHSSSLTEDTGILSSGSLTVSLSSSDVDESGALDLSTSVSLTGVENSPEGNNPRGKSFIQRAGRTGLSYTEHGWGRQTLVYEIEFSEPRGFNANNIVSYTQEVKLNVNVISAPDSTTIDAFTSTPFTGNEFPEERKQRVVKSGRVVFRDADLLFDTVKNVFGDTMTPSSSMSSGEMALTFSPTSYALDESLRDKVRDDIIVIDPLGYSLRLTKAEAGEISSVLLYEIGFSFGTSNPQINFPHSSSYTVSFQQRIDNSVLVENSAFMLAGIGTANSTEDDPTGTVVATIEIEDEDLRRNPSTGLNSFNYRITGGGDLFGWEDSPSATVSDNTTQRDLILLRAPQDKDVNRYILGWEIEDRSAVNDDGAQTTKTLSGTINVTILSIDDTPSDLSLRLGSGRLNTNMDTSSILNVMELSWRDNDFTEVFPLVTAYHANYTNAEFMLDPPTGPDYSCTISNPNLSGSAHLIADNRLGTGNIMSFVEYDRDMGTVSLTSPQNLRVDEDGRNTGSHGKDEISAPLSLEHIKSRPSNLDCRDPLIGTRIVGVLFSSVWLADFFPANIGAGYEFTGVSAMADYSIAGYRKVEHSSRRLNGGNITFHNGIPTGEKTTRSITLVATDGDADDGVPHSPDLAGNGDIIRDNTRQWGGGYWRSQSNFSQCAGLGVGVEFGDWREHPTDPASSILGVDLVFTSPAQAIAEGSTCEIKITDGEDGQSISHNLTVILGTDEDGDGLFSQYEIDDDGDGLIEIHNATELNMVRNNLNGASLVNLIRTDSANITIVNSLGCGNGKDITSCFGYELINNIDLTAANFTDWEPIGNTTHPFRAVFEGNGHFIDGMDINIGGTTSAVGFFRIAEGNSSIQNVRLRNSKIVAKKASCVGGLVGQLDDDARIMGSSFAISGAELSARRELGGLVGCMSDSSSIVSSSVDISASLVASNSIGGLVGRMSDSSSIVSSSVDVSASLDASNSIGGMVGRMSDSSSIEFSSVDVSRLSSRGSHFISGMVGEMSNSSRILSSSVLISRPIRLEESFCVGGMAGVIKDNSQIEQSTLRGPALVAKRQLGGLVGCMAGSSRISSSSTQFSGSLKGESFIGGLVGHVEGGMTEIVDSHAVVDQIEGDTALGGLLGGTAIETKDQRGNEILVDVTMTIKLIRHSYARSRVLYAKAGGGTVGGLVGQLTGASFDDALIETSYAVNSERIEGYFAAGLVGYIIDGDIRSSFAVSREITDHISYSGHPGGLVSAALNSDIYSSYAVSRLLDGPWAAGMVGFVSHVPVNVSSITIAQSYSLAEEINGFLYYPRFDINEGYFENYHARPFITSAHSNINFDAPVNNSVISIRDSYWDASMLTGNALIATSPYLGAEGKSSAELLGATNQNYLAAGSVYENWTEGYCNPDNGATSLSSIPTADTVTWDFGSVSEYPVLRCMKNLGVGEQRALIASALVKTPSTNIPAPSVNDIDGDGVSNNDDNDRDGNGLIEIDSASELLGLAGKLGFGSPQDRADGCVPFCNGYELLADIDLGGANWEPLGNCGNDPLLCQDTSNHFDASFDGRNHTVSNFVIRASHPWGVGFFGALGPGRKISNLYLRDFSFSGHGTNIFYDESINTEILADTNSAIYRSARYVGGMVGSMGDWTSLENVQVSGLSAVKGGEFVGGMTGHMGYAARIKDAVIDVGEISTATTARTASFAGGLVGYAGSLGANIINAGVRVGKVEAGSYAGGLVGFIGPYGQIEKVNVQADTIRVGGVPRSVSKLVDNTGNNTIEKYLFSSHKFFDGETLEFVGSHYLPGTSVVKPDPIKFIVGDDTAYNNTSSLSGGGITNISLPTVGGTINRIEVEPGFVGGIAGSLFFTDVSNVRVNVGTIRADGWNYSENDISNFRDASGKIGNLRVNLNAALTHAGGVAGYGQSAIIKNASVNAAIIEAERKVGGVLGHSENNHGYPGVVIESVDVSITQRLGYADSSSIEVGGVLGSSEKCDPWQGRVSGEFNWKRHSVLTLIHRKLGHNCNVISYNPIYNHVLYDPYFRIEVGSEDNRIHFPYGVAHVAPLYIYNGGIINSSSVSVAEIRGRTNLGGIVGMGGDLWGKTKLSALFGTYSGLNFNNINLSISGGFHIGGSGDDFVDPESGHRNKRSTVGIVAGSADRGSYKNLRIDFSGGIRGTTKCANVGEIFGLGRESNMNNVQLSIDDGNAKEMFFDQLSTPNNSATLFPLARPIPGCVE